jgi:hypothetical protein
MPAEQTPAITDTDVRSLAAKLKGLHALLTPPERALLGLVLGRAAAREEATLADVEGFAWTVSFNPFPYLDAIELDVPNQQGVRHRGAACPNKRRRTTASDTARRWR